MGVKKLSQLLLKNRADLVRSVPSANEIAKVSVTKAASVARQAALDGGKEPPAGAGAPPGRGGGARPKSGASKRSKNFVASARDHLSPAQYNELYALLMEHVATSPRHAKRAWTWRGMHMPCHI